MDPELRGEGLKLNISESDNAQDLSLVRDVAPYFRVGEARVREVLDEVLTAVADWRAVATDHGLSASAQGRMKRAFRMVGAQG